MEKADGVRDPALAYFGERLVISWLYPITLSDTRDFVERGVRVLPANRFFAALV